MGGAFSHAHLHEPGNVWARFVVRAVATVAVASVSWFVIEKPINGLKRFFEYAHPKAAPHAA